MTSRKAITLIELILVVSIGLLLLAVAVPQNLSTLFRNDLEIASQELVHVLRKAQAQASTQVYDSAWGVQFDSGSRQYTLFAGSTYASRNSDHDVLYELPGAVEFGTLSMGTELVFEQGSGETSQPGSLELLGVNGDSKNITVNSYGHAQHD